MYLLIEIFYSLIWVEFFLEDNVLLAPRVSLLFMNHAEAPTQRQNLILKAVHIKKGAWIGAGASVLPGVTVG